MVKVQLPIGHLIRKTIKFSLSCKRYVAVVTLHSVLCRMFEDTPRKLVKLQDLVKIYSNLSQSLVTKTLAVFLVSISCSQQVTNVGLSYKVHKAAENAID